MHANLGVGQGVERMARRYEEIGVGRVRRGGEASEGAALVAPGLGREGGGFNASRL